MKGFRHALAMALMLLLLASALFAENFVAVNSLDGRDVLSGIFYANALGYPVKFMPVPASGVDTFAAKVGSGKDILLIQSADRPVSGFVESELAKRGNSVEVLPTTDGAQTNLALARRSGAQGFVLVDSAYSDSAISALPYAAYHKYYIILADKGNAGEVAQIVGGKKVVIYGYVDKEVASAAAPMNPVRIGDGADKYADNVKIAGMLIDALGPGRPIITDGGTLEDAIADGRNPVILSGRLVPQVTYDFIKGRVDGGDVTGVLLVGNEYVAPVYDMRERMKADFASEGKNKTFGIMVKFAQAIPSAQAGVMTLDTFRLPAYRPSLDITEITYNRNTGKVMVGMVNTGDGPVYYELELRVKKDGEDFKTFGQKEPVLIGRGESAGLEFPLDISAVQEGTLTATALARFGSTPGSLEEYKARDSVIQTIAYVDNSNVTVKFAKYDKKAQVLRITLKNNGDGKAYAFVKAALLDDSGTQVRISASATREIDPGSLYVEEFPLIMSEKEIALNREIGVSVDYGGRLGFLVKKADYTVPLEGEAAAQDFGFLAGAAAVLLIALLVYIVYKAVTRKRK